MNQKSPKQIRGFASAIAKGHSLQSAMLQAGYAPSTARRGKAALSKPMWQALARETQMLQLLARKISREQQENLVRGRLVQNVITGRDDAVQSARQLGADRRISMWQSESQTGLIVLQAPLIRPVGHPVPLLPPSRYAENEDEPGE